MQCVLKRVPSTDFPSEGCLCNVANHDKFGFFKLDETYKRSRQLLISVNCNKF